MFEKRLGCHAPELLCLAYSLRPHVCCRVRSGGQLFAHSTGPSFVNRLTYVARHLVWERAERMGTRSIRAGAVRTILVSGGSFAQVVKVGQRQSLALLALFGASCSFCQYCSICQNCQKRAKFSIRIWGEKRRKPWRVCF